MYVKGPEEALDFLRKHIETLNKKVDEVVPTFKKLEVYDTKPFDILNYRLDRISNNGKYLSYTYGTSKFHEGPFDSEEQIIERRDALLKILDEILPTFEETRLKNQELIEHNKVVIEKIKLFMTTIGIPSSYSERDMKSRARNPKYITKSAGYLEDIRRNIATIDSGYANLVKNIDNHKKSIETWASNHIKSFRELKKAQEEKDALNKKAKTLAYLTVKYDLPIESDEYEILDVILKKDKYLRLAHFMSKNRNNWNDGPYYASVGLDAFKVETDEDHEIENDISQHIYNWDGDGRIFRDCEWNYNRLFSKVDSELMKDYNMIEKFCNDF